MRTGHPQFFAILVCSVTFSVSALAHDPGLSSAAITVGDRDIRVVALFHSRDLQQLIKNDAASYPSLVNQILHLRHGGESLSSRLESVEKDVNDNVKFQLSYIRPPVGAITVSSGIIGRLPFGHREFVTIRTASGESLGDRLLSARENEFTVLIASAAKSRAGSGFADFFLLGIRHIVTGYDHLLFLLGLLVVTRSFVSSLKIITCFTIAHSITLAVATFSLVEIPSRIVEPLIAASIVYVGVENRLRGDDTKGRHLLTFGFGLIHGFGFASVLREMGVGSRAGGVAAPLFSFNLGVELGQMIIAAAALPIIWKLWARPVFIERWAPTCSAVIMLLGAIWLVERVWTD
jgi:hydrogenase/urease accessory protein HupE